MERLEQLEWFRLDNVHTNVRTLPRCKVAFEFPFLCLLRAGPRRPSSVGCLSRLALHLGLVASPSFLHSLPQSSSFACWALGAASAAAVVYPAGASPSLSTRRWHPWTHVLADGVNAAARPAALAEPRCRRTKLSLLSLPARSCFVEGTPRSQVDARPPHLLVPGRHREMTVYERTLSEIHGEIHR